MTNKQKFGERMRSIIASSKGEMGRLEKVTHAITEAANEFGFIKELRILVWDEKTIGEAISYFEDDDLLNEYILGEDDESFTETATVATSEKLKLRIAVNPNPGRRGVPYFKVYDDPIPKKRESQVARPHFKDEGMEYHNGVYYDWDLKGGGLKDIKQLLQTPHEDFDPLTNWQIACFQWNVEYGFIGLSRENRSKYFNHEFDERFKDDPSYVLSTQPIPEKWIYDPPKGKGKKRKK